MHFEVEHVFDAPIEVVELAMFHPDYYAFLRSRQEVLSGVAPQTREEDRSSITRRVHYKPKPAFDHIGPKKVPPEWFEFVEQSKWDKTTRKLTFDNVPCTDKVARRLTTHGEMVLEQLPSGKTRRRARAELKVQNLPFMLRPLAGVAEQMLAREAKKLLEEEARVLGEFLVTDTVRDS